MKQLSIFGKEFSVTWSDDLGNAIGDCTTALQRIRVLKGLPKDNERETLLHEVIHAVEESLVLGLTEQQVHSLACGLYAVFKDNQTELLKYLKEKK